MIDRYLAMMQNYSARDRSMVALAVLAFGIAIWLPIIETSPFTRSRYWQIGYWLLYLAAFTCGMLVLGQI